MSGMKVSLQSHLECPTHVVTSQSWQSVRDRHCKKWPLLVWKWEQCDWLEGTVLAKCVSSFGIWARAAPQVITESTSLTTIKKDFCLLISYLFFLCISISVVVPSGNSSIRLGVEHCISKLQVVKEFDRRNGLNPCRQHVVIFTWFTRYSFLQFAICKLLRVHLLDKFC